jgi:hypothetical protein
MAKSSRFVLFTAGYLFSLGVVVPADAATFTSSSAFDAATAGASFTVEQYASGMAGQLIPNGGSACGAQSIGRSAGRFNEST